MKRFAKSYYRHTYCISLLRACYGQLEKCRINLFPFFAKCDIYLTFSIPCAVQTKEYTYFKVP